MSIEIGKTPSSPFSSVDMQSKDAAKNHSIQAENAAVSNRKNVEKKRMERSSPKTQLSDKNAEKQAKKLLDEELEMMVKVHIVLTQLESHLADQQVKISDKITVATKKNAAKEVKKIEEAQKKLEAAKKKQKQMKTIGIIVSVFAGLLAIMAGVEAMIAVAAMMALQYSGATDEMTKNMSDGQKAGVSIGLGAAIGLATGGAGAIMFTDTAAAAAEGAGVAAADDAAADGVEAGAENAPNRPQTRTEAFAAGARFGTMAGTMQMLMATNVIEKNLKKLFGKGKAADILTIITSMLIVLAALAAAGNPSSAEGGIAGQIEAKFGTTLPSYMKNSSVMIPRVLATGMLGASAAKATLQSELAQIQFEQAKLSREMAAVLEKKAILKFSSTVLENLQKRTKENLKSSAKSYDMQVQSLGSLSLGFEALARVMAARAV